MTMHIVSSPDGTKIAYDRHGEGPALIVVNGALCTRSSNSKAELASLLAPRLTVYSYDRRGRGDSGDTLPYAVDREIEDIGALIEEAGGFRQPLRSLLRRRAGHGSHGQAQPRRGHQARDVRGSL